MSEDIQDFNNNFVDSQQEYNSGGNVAKKDPININQKQPEHRLDIDHEKAAKRYDSIRMSGRNFNNEFMVSLWHDYHHKSNKKYKFLYYDPK